MIKIAILGAGPAGLSLAYHLNSEDVSVDIYDSNDKPGGLATSVYLWDNKVELGPHFLRKGGCQELDAMIEAVLTAEDRTVIDRNTKILFKDSKFSYPPNPAEMVKHLSIGQLFSALLSLLKSQIIRRKPMSNAQDYLTGKLGGFLYNLFIRSYSEKLWGTSPSALHQSYAQNLLPFVDTKAILKKIYRSLLCKNATTELWDFPNGFDVLWQKAFEEVNKKHTCYMGARINRINHHNGRVESISSDLGTQYYDLVISTIPAFSLFGLMGQSFSSSPPDFRHTLLVYFLVSGEVQHSEHCLYLYSSDYKSIRLTNFGRSMTEKDKNILMLEYWLSDEELLKQAYFLQLATLELQAINGAPLVIEQQHHLVLQRAYRVPNHDLYKQHQAQQNMLAQYENLIPLGRNNSINFNYGMEQAVGEGAQLARKLTRRAQQSNHTFLFANQEISR